MSKLQPLKRAQKSKTD